MSLLSRQKPEAFKPFAGYENFAACVEANADKDSPEGYCAEIMRNVEGKAFEEQRTILSGMVALYPDPVIAEQVAVIPSLELTSAGVKVTPPDELHITLVYFPSIEESEVDALVQKVATALANCPPGPIITRAEGNAQFLPTDEGLTPHVVLFDPTALSYLHDALSGYCCDTVPVAQNHGFIPHMTLAYAPPSADLNLEPPSPQELLFDKAVLKIGDSISHTFAIGMSSASPASPPMMGTHYMSLRGKLDRSATAGDPPPVHRSASQTDLDGTMPTKAVVAERATWTTAYQNDLPDSAFLFIESGGSKDSTGRTEPRSLRHFPVRDANGDVDLPHLRNAIARIPQSNAPGLTPEKKSSLQDRARGMLEEASKTIVEKSGRRVGSNWRVRLTNVVDNLKEMLSWANYEDGEQDDEEDMPMMGGDHKPMRGQMKKEIGESSFVVFKDTTGHERWLAFSSNGFLDREREIVSTKALEDAVEVADSTGKRGPLRLWHTKGTDIGDCDFQAVQGRFLIESGTFRDDEMSIRAKTYLQRTDEPLGISIGFLYPEEQLSADGVYGTIGFIERSVAPHDEVANPWTKFETLKGDAMNQKKTDWLRTVLGEEKAAAVIATADSATKELEGHVAFKTADGLQQAVEAFGTALSASDASEEAKAAWLSFQKTLAVKKDAESDSTADNTAKADSTAAAGADNAGTASDSQDDEAPDLVSALKELITPLTTAVVKVQADLAALSDRTKLIESAQAEKAQKETDATPRGRDIFRASASDQNVLDAAKAKEMLGDNDPPASPVKAYIDDLLGNRS